MLVAGYEAERLLLRDEQALRKTHLKICSLFKSRL